MNSDEFCDRYLPDDWCERDLQLLIQKRLRRFGLLAAPDEVRIKTPTATRRIDLATWLCNYEVKKWLTRENIFHAVAQTELYNHYGPKLLWIIPKRRVVVGLAPSDPYDYEAARKVAEDFRAMGIKIVFINETAFHSPELPASLGMAILAVAISFLTAYLITAS
ncbi:hypothetical protein NDI37_22010 [Funiculus sociatus GB2-A5]|uniref:Uncharacterized protein n=1 Tax=Funiculus sociatus GB2-A5 TaxID=2933946 RepID=A0ABV0JUI8_9CYAN|nr:hypothetical protein [Trichocoleus sp. FACHB-6]MBD2060772.1 hypothetical protein [Trichocoleus sp. FACHB-6]